jgi:O-antigen ligase
MQSTVYTGLKPQTKVKQKKSFVTNFSLIFLAVVNVIPFYSSLGDSSLFYGMKYAALGLFFLVLLSNQKNDPDAPGLHLGMITILLGVCFLNLINFKPYLVDSTSKYVLNTVINVMVGAFAIYIFPYIKFERFKYFLYASLIVMFFAVTITSMMNMNNPSLFYYTDDRLRYQGVFSNPNVLARFALLGIFISLRLWTLYSHKLSKAFFLVNIIANAYIIYLTNSRTSLLSMMLVLGLLTVIGIRSKLPRLLFVSGVFLISGAVFAVAIQKVIQFLSSPTVDINKLSSGRTSIWNDILSGSWQQLTFGTGPMEIVGGHNGYLEILKYYGFIGIFLWLMVIATLFIKKAKAPLSYGESSASRNVGLVVVLAMLAYYFFEGGLLSTGNLASLFFWIELSQRNTARTNDKPV